MHEDKWHTWHSCPNKHTAILVSHPTLFSPPLFFPTWMQTCSGQWQAGGGWIGPFKHFACLLKLCCLRNVQQTSDIVWGPEKSHLCNFPVKSLRGLEFSGLQWFEPDRLLNIRVAPWGSGRGWHWYCAPSLLWPWHKVRTQWSFNLSKWKSLSDVCL